MGDDRVVAIKRLGPAKDDSFVANFMEFKHEVSVMRYVFQAKWKQNGMNRLKSVHSILFPFRLENIIISFQLTESSQFDQIVWSDDESSADDHGVCTSL